jgi:Ni,Fe-hydrogenase III large subunit
MTQALSLHNGSAADMQKVPLLSPAEFRQTVLEAVAGGARIASLFGFPFADKTIRFMAVLADGMTGSLTVLSAQVRDSFPALTIDCLQADPFEREIAEQWVLKPEGHPAAGPLRVPAAARFLRSEDDEVHEVAVGPVHAGIIEPGHFRFLAHGEEVLNLEIALGYQHRGVERAVVGGPDKRTIHYMETLCGDSSVGHATAYAQAVEALATCRVPPRAEALRAIALELERLANHTGDLGALAGDVAYLPTASYGGRLRGDFLNMTALLCGSRFGRSLVRLGGVRFDLDKDHASRLLKLLAAAAEGVTQAVNLLWDTPSVLARFEGVGGLPRSLAETLGIVGPAARASGLERDVRFEFPAGFYRYAQIPLCTWHTGDVFSRAYLRWMEIQRSLAFVRERLMTLPAGEVQVPCGNPQPGQIAVSLVEGWRGEICHVAITDERGRFLRYKVVDPSFHNWKGLALAMRGGQISDFPLINKSFNLSYAGHDL